MEKVKGAGKWPSCNRMSYLLTLTSDFFSDGYLVPVVVMGGGEGWRENKWSIHFKKTLLLPTREKE